MTYSFRTIFPVMLFIGCLILSTVIPPFQSPDEFDHIKRAYLLTEGVIVLDKNNGTSSGGLIDTGLLDYMRVFEDIPFNREVKVTAERLQKANHIHWTGTYAFSPAPGTGYYFPLIYSPQAFGLWVGQTIGASLDTSYRMARLMALFSSSVLLFFAFRLSRPPVIAAWILVIPMSLFQLASASLDGVTIALCVFIVSSFFQLSRHRAEAKRGLVWALMAGVLLLTLSRVYLTPLLLLSYACFFYTKKNRDLITATMSTVITLCWTLIAIKTTSDGRIIAGAGKLEILFFYLSNPLALFKVLYATLSDGALLKFYLSSFIGVLGWLDTWFDQSVYWFLACSFVFAIVFTVRFGKLRGDCFERSILIACAGCCVLLTFVSLLVGWNPHPAITIQGVQGRYFIPPAIIAAYALSRSEVVSHRSRDYFVTLLITVVLLFSTASAYKTLLDRYWSVGAI